MTLTSPEQNAAIYALLDFCQQEGGKECFPGWDKHEIWVYLMYHVGKGSFALATDDLGLPVGVVTWWRIKEVPQTQEFIDKLTGGSRDIKDDPDGKIIYHDICICKDPTRWKTLFDQFKRLTPDWEECTYLSYHHGRLVTFPARWRFAHG